MVLWQAMDHYRCLLFFVSETSAIQNIEAVRPLLTALHNADVYMQVACNSSQQRAQRSKYCPGQEGKEVSTEIHGKLD